MAASTTELSNGFAVQRYRQSAIPTCPMYHRYHYVSFVEFSEERIRGDRRGTSNKRVCSRDIEGPQRKESVVSNKRIGQSISSCEEWKILWVIQSMGSHYRYYFVTMLAFSICGSSSSSVCFFGRCIYRTIVPLGKSRFFLLVLRQINYGLY